MCLAQSLLFRWILNKQPVTILSVILHTIKFQVDGLAIREERPLFGFEHALITTSKEQVSEAILIPNGPSMLIPSQNALPWTNEPTESNIYQCAL